MMKRCLTIAGVLALAFVIGGCARHNWYGPCLHPFPGEVPPDDQIGMLTESDMGITNIDGIDYDQMAAWVGEDRGWIWSSRYAHWDLLPGEHTVEVTGRVWETEEDKVRWWLWGWAVDREAWDSIAPHSQLCVSVPDNLGLPHDVCVIKGAWRLTFTVEPEHKYHIRFETENEGLPSTGAIAIESDYRTQLFTGGLTPVRVYPYVEDDATGERVGTCTPIEDRELAKSPGW